ncbi:site-2 protease family protein [bacterium]|nr:site-2 protease family protein [bacterium]
MLNFQEVIIGLVVLAFSVIIHEVAHGFVAFKLGDPTAKINGRLTLNPIPHVDIFGTIVFPIVCFLLPGGFMLGWAKPVPINPSFFKKIKRDEILVSVAGPFSNLILALFFTTWLGFLYLLLPESFLSRYPGFELLCWLGIKWNIVLAVFNLLPIPPLDGAHVLRNTLPEKLGNNFAKLWPFGFLILILLMNFGVLSKLILPLIDIFLDNPNGIIFKILNLFV